jgi:hypothetical protein
VYTKLQPNPPFGARMPLEAAPLDAATTACVLAWITQAAEATQGGAADAGGAAPSGDAGSGGIGDGAADGNAGEGGAE